MKKIVLSLFIADIIALVILFSVGWVYQDNEPLMIMTQCAATCFVALLVVVCALDDLLRAAADIGKELRHPQLDAIMVIAGGTLLAVISADAYGSPFAASLALLIGLGSLTAGWQFGHQQCGHNGSIKGWHSRH